MNTRSWQDQEIKVGTFLWECLQWPAPTTYLFLISWLPARIPQLTQHRQPAEWQRELRTLLHRCWEDDAWMEHFFLMPFLVFEEMLIQTLWENIKTCIHWKGKSKFSKIWKATTKVYTSLTSQCKCLCPCPKGNIMSLCIKQI